MPEGPEIRLAADEVEAAIAGKPVQDVVFAFPHLKKYQSRLRGKTVLGVKTRGKAMLTLFEDDWVIYSHNQLYGRWYICPKGEQPQTNRQLRLAIHNDTASALLYSASDIDVLKREQLAQHPFLARLGPDLLSEDPPVEVLVERLQSPAFCRRQFAGLLLDQGFVAGLGNYLRAEILLVAGLHPERKPIECSSAALLRLAKAIKRITLRAYKNRGVVTPPSLVKTLKAGGKRHKESYRFMVYGRGGQACYQCGGKIERQLVGGRPLYFCRGCQR